MVNSYVMFVTYAFMGLKVCVVIKLNEVSQKIYYPKPRLEVSQSGKSTHKNSNRKFFLFGHFDEDSHKTRLCPLP